MAVFLRFFLAGSLAGGFEEGVAIEADEVEGKERETTETEGSACLRGKEETLEVD